MQERSNFKIEKGVSLPDKKRPKVFKYPFKEMEVGDSFLVGSDQRRLVVVGIRLAFIRGRTMDR